MRKNGNFKLVFGAFCFIFLVYGYCNALASEQSLDVSTQSPGHIARQPFSDAVDNLDTDKSSRQYQQAIQEAQDLANLTELREKALNSQPAAGHGSSFDTGYRGRKRIHY